MFILTLLAYAGFLCFIHFSTLFNSCGTMIIAFSQFRLYLDMLVVIGINNSLDYLIYSWKLNFSDSITYSLMKVRNEKGNLDSSENLPDNLETKLREYNRMNE